MNSVLIVVTLATLAAIYMISARGKPASAWVAATRTAVYTAIIGVALSAYALLTNLTAAEPISPIMLVFACPVLAIVAFLYTYWEDRTASLMTVLSTVWLFGLVSYAANEGGMRYGAGVLIAIPLGLRVMRLLDFASRPAYRVKRLTRSATRVSPTHYLHPLFEIAYQPGADTFTLKKALRLTKATKTAAGQTDPLLEYNEPVLIERTTGSNDIWHTNLACNFKKLTRTEYGQTVTSTYVPGTFTSGTTSSGEFVTMNTPGQTVYSSTPNGKTYEVDTGKTGATVSLSVAGKMQFIDLGVVTASEEKAIREVVAAIETLQAPRIAERNAAAIAERQRVRDEAAMALKQRQELAEQEKLAAQQAIAQRQQAALDQVLQWAGITAAAADLFLHRTHIPKTGELFELIVADRDGRGAAVADAGKSVWVGHWHGAEAQVAEGCLHLKLDDDAYRREHLAERRIKLLASGGLALQQQWADRITILSRAASQA